MTIVSFLQAPTGRLENPALRANPNVDDWNSAQAPELVGPSEAVPHAAILPRAWGWLESAILAGFAVVVALGIAWHEPWSDEAQAWLLARDNGWSHLMFHSIRYEGTPGLWHTLLWLLVRLHIGYAGMHWVSGAIAAAGIFVLLRWSPFPLILRVLIPFGFWLAYQDAVVARSYVLYAALVFPAAAILRNATRRTPAPRLLAALAVLLGLIANVSVHGFIASIGIAIVAWVVLRRRIQAGAPVRRGIPALILCAFWAFAVVTTFPPRDVSFPAGENLRRSAEKILARVGDRAEARRMKAETAIYGVRPGELIPVPPIVHHRTAVQSLWDKVGRILSVLTYPVATFRWLALALCILVIAQAVATRAGPGQTGWVGLLPWVLMVIAFSSLYLAPRHAGMVWESLVVALWLTWPEKPPCGAAALWLRRITLAALILCCIDQVWWTAHSVWADMHEPYSGDVEMAKFLKSQESGKRIAGFSYHSIGVEAFFPDRLYFNQPASYWYWNRNFRVDEEAPATIATHPDILVVGGWEWSPHNGNITDEWIPMAAGELNPVPLGDAYQIIPYAEAHGYRITHRFCGHSFMRAGYAEELCQVALQPVH